MKIITLRHTETIKYAAQELAKYLEMMDGTVSAVIDFGDADIKLGLFADLGLPTDDVDDLDRQWRDRFGPLPREVAHLLTVHKIRILATRRNISQVEISGQKLMLTRNNDYILDNNIGPREFLGYFDKADVVITDSFHGSVFAMLMGAKNFFSYIQPISKTGSRITNLLKTVGEPNHLLPSDLAKSYKELDNEKVDKAALYKRIAEVREHARGFLKRNI